MTPEDFYNKRNIVKRFNKGKTQHYPQRRDSFFAVKTTTYILTQGENLMSLAGRVFGSENTRLWTMLAELNPSRDFNSWKEGDTVIIPLLIVPNTQNVTEPEQATSKKSKFYKRKKTYGPVDPVVCGVPANLSAETFPDKIVYTWDGAANVIYYLYQFKASADVDWGVNTICFNTTVTITGLSQNTAYDFRVKAVCSYGGVSAYISLLNVETGAYPQCSNVGVLTLTNAYTDHADFFIEDFFTGPPGLGYEVWYRPTGAPDWTTQVINVDWGTLGTDGLAFTIFGLSVDTEYEVKVRRICGSKVETYYGAFSNVVTFGTFSLCGAVSAITIVNTDLDRFKISWTAGAGNDGYRLFLYKLDTTLLLEVFTGFTEYEFTGLEGSTGYRVVIMPSCGEMTGGRDSIIVWTTGNACVPPTLLLAEEISGLVGPPKKRRIHVIVAVQPGRLVNYYGGGVLLIEDSPFSDVILEIEDDTWSLTHALVTVQTVCGVASISASVTEDVIFAYPDPTGGFATCTVPAFISIDNVTDVSADAHWDFGVGVAVPDNVTGYKIRLTRVSDNAQVEFTVGVVSVFAFTGLTNGQVYNVEIKTLCTNDTESNYSNPVIPFTTNEAGGGGGGGDI